MAVRSRHRVFDEQPSTELATGAWLAIEEADGEKRVILEPDGEELKRWGA